MDVTLFELHVSDAEFNAPFAGRKTAAEADEPSPEPADEREPSPRLGPLAVMLAFVGLALLARYLRGTETEQATLDELEA